MSSSSTVTTPSALLSGVFDSLAVSTCEVDSTMASVGARSGTPWVSIFLRQRCSVALMVFDVAERYSSPNRARASPTNLSHRPSSSVLGEVGVAVLATMANLVSVLVKERTIVARVLSSVTLLRSVHSERGSAVRPRKRTIRVNQRVVELSSARLAVVAVCR